MALQLGTAFLNLQDHDRLRRVSWGLVNGPEQIRAAAEVERAPTTVPVASEDPDPAHRTRFKPHNKSQKNRPGRGPYVTKKFKLPLTRLLTNHEHKPQPAPTRHVCEFCRFVFHDHPGEARVDQLRGVIDCPGFFVPDKPRSTSKQCGFCEIPLCAKFCFEYFHRVEVDTEGNITGCRPPL
jgi:hypothetical protein